MLLAARKRARELGCAAMDLEVDSEHARAAHLYGRDGFEKLHRERWVRRLQY
jgi:ribosomal protein S18 acetylase RimI-like enzyme